MIIVGGTERYTCKCWVSEDGKVRMVTAREIMMEFADFTGLSRAGEVQQRYLWTDAFAVCNFLELYRQTGDEEYKHLSLRLVDQVHNTLGRHRGDDRRTGWISGLTEEEGGWHPTLGGLRIGKGIKERGPQEPYDENLEWDSTILSTDTSPTGRFRRQPRRIQREWHRRISRLRSPTWRGCVREKSGLRTIRSASVGSCVMPTQQRN